MYSSVCHMEGQKEQITLISNNCTLNWISIHVSQTPTGAGHLW
jgi:hypothetical protein